jgi:hypothetical protein
VRSWGFHAVGGAGGAGGSGASVQQGSQLRTWVTIRAASRRSVGGGDGDSGFAISAPARSILPCRSRSWIFEGGGQRRHGVCRAMPTSHYGDDSAGMLAERRGGGGTGGFSIAPLLQAGCRGGQRGRAEVPPVLAAIISEEADGTDIATKVIAQPASSRRAPVVGGNGGVTMPQPPLKEVPVLPSVAPVWWRQQRRRHRQAGHRLISTAGNDSWRQCAERCRLGRQRPRDLRKRSTVAVRHGGSGAAGGNASRVFVDNSR